MVSDKLKALVRPTALLMAVVWAGEFLTFCVYYFIVRVSATQEQAGATEGDTVLLAVFGLMGAASLVAGVVFRWYIFSQRRARTFLSREPGEATGPVAELTREEQNLLLMARQTFPLYLMSLGMVNSCALFGLVLALIGRSPDVFSVFAVAAAVAWGLCFPRLGAFIESSLVDWQNSFRR